MKYYIVLILLLALAPWARSQEQGQVRPLPSLSDLERYNLQSVAMAGPGRYSDATAPDQPYMPGQVLRSQHGAYIVLFRKDEVLRFRCSGNTYSDPVVISRVLVKDGERKAEEEPLAAILEPEAGEGQARARQRQLRFARKFTAVVILDNGMLEGVR
jgi:hypothetical protein